MSASIPPPTPHLWLVGAGPGDPDLMTLKGAKALAQAQLVLYDSLVHQEVLNMAHPDAELVCVGKELAKPARPKSSSTTGLNAAPDRACASFV